MTGHVVIGIDPGLSGAIAVLSPDGALVVHDMPTHRLTRTELDLPALAHIFDGLAKEAAPVAFLERVGAMPGQGVSSMFKFGTCFGALQGLLAAHFIPVTLVTPQSWKRAMGCPAGKDAARARASQLLPRQAGLWPLKKHDGRAEAALIALYGQRQGGDR
ncbi:hypothetical protein [Nitrospirillum iridis]|uniref:Crossover junction endodeoxyribonuclease RuvC n=1 Tax=Nitrospirillum iridis TaxID=765888 RepID=A0A7X0B3N6_9PROT|nr:hypothetical protein [Nitrospirillum iridis]MBB6254110.1 crossover junction endodeoxyribonuclease RuvC [Nitrospirillum iridis]